MYKLNRTDPDHNNASNTKLRFFSSFVSVSRNGTVKMTLIDNISDHLKVWKIFHTEYVFDLYIYSNSRFLYSKETLLDKHFFLFYSNEEKTPFECSEWVMPHCNFEHTNMLLCKIHRTFKPLREATLIKNKDNLLFILPKEVYFWGVMN